MKILVFAHRLELGGTQTNAAELSAAIREGFGHEVVVFAAPGPAAELMEQRGLRLIAAPDATTRPSPRVMAALRRTVRSEQPDLIHAWDSPQCLDAYYGVHVPWRVPLLCSSMTMTVERCLPRSIPLTFGTPELADRARRSGRRHVSVLVPPVDTDANRPSAVDVAEFNRRVGISSHHHTVVVVSRLVDFLKLDGLRRAISAVEDLADDMPIRLIVVGEGAAAADLHARADGVNRRLGRDAVIFTGGMVDPRPAYAAADVVLGMGSSALRGMAFAKPVVVLGGAGFSEIFHPGTSARFLHQGFYGMGDGSLSPDPLAAQIRRLIEDDRWRNDIATFSRRVVMEQFALAPLAQQLEALYRRTVARPVSPARSVVGAVRTGAVCAASRTVAATRLRERTANLAKGWR